VWACGAAQGLAPNASRHCSLRSGALPVLFIYLFIYLFIHFKHRYRYFDPLAVRASLDPIGQPYGALCEAYFNFVVARVAAFSGKGFAELAAVAPLEAAVTEVPKEGAGGGAGAGSAERALVTSDQAAAVLDAASGLVELALAVPCVQPLSSGSRAARTVAVQVMGPPTASPAEAAAVAAAAARLRPLPGKKAAKAAKAASGSGAGATVVTEVVVPAAVPNSVACGHQFEVAADLESLWKHLSLAALRLVDAATDACRAAAPVPSPALPVVAAAAADAAVAGEGGSAPEEPRVAEDPEVALALALRARELARWWLGALPRVGSWRRDYARSKRALLPHAKPEGPEHPKAEKWLSAGVLRGRLNDLDGAVAAVPRPSPAASAARQAVATEADAKAQAEEKAAAAAAAAALEPGARRAAGGGACNDDESEGEDEEGGMAGLDDDEDEDDEDDDDDDDDDDAEEDDDEDEDNDEDDDEDEDEDSDN
jgi:hypothetical protein